ncbi:uncharacterized protein I303_103304 [Kwoniella dejecticola CBS 10117]|uniref:Uncharacterized protein n=1 Tax=Kwoniella dejecticola CBS 10117 TaxID=1296121 RepID=A0A1A6A6D7_9TREE|nr:uncharacterized protein I303_03327 [Kwoniella dejecticola CBS 10117]OBR85616.1 hypothetical protein I303_03327 [Kwoniella dejecticola CBS 10117]
MIPRALPYVNFIVASSALLFQTTVLYPWHHILSDDFEKLKAEQARQLEEHHREKRQLLDALHLKVEDLTRTVAPERFRQAGNEIIETAQQQRTL